MQRLGKLLATPKPSGNVPGGGFSVMQRLGKLLATPKPSGNVPEAESCTHATLTPRWRGPDVMDDDSKAMGFICHRCHSEFLPYQVHNRQLRTR